MAKLKYNFIKIFFILFSVLFIFIESNAQEANNYKMTEYCNENNPDMYDEFMCAEQRLHKSMLSNPLGFIIFYIVGIFFIAFLYRMSTRNLRNKKK